MNLVNEDGLCRLSELKPEACGCRYHRGKGIKTADEAVIREMVGKQPSSSNLSTGIGFIPGRDDQ